MLTGFLFYIMVLYNINMGYQAETPVLIYPTGTPVPFIPPPFKKSPYFCRKWDKKNYNDLLKSKPSPMY